MKDLKLTHCDRELFKDMAKGELSFCTRTRSWKYFPDDNSVAVEVTYKIARSFVDKCLSLLDVKSNTCCCNVYSLIKTPQKAQNKPLSDNNKECDKGVEEEKENTLEGSEWIECFGVKPKEINYSDLIEVIYDDCEKAQGLAQDFVFTLTCGSDKNIKSCRIIEKAFDGEAKQQEKDLADSLLYAISGILRDKPKKKLPIVTIEQYESIHESYRGNRNELKTAMWGALCGVTGIYIDGKKLNHSAQEGRDFQIGEAEPEYTYTKVMDHMQNGRELASINIRVKDGVNVGYTVKSPKSTWTYGALSAKLAVDVFLKLQEDANRKVLNDILQDYPISI